MAAWPSPEVQAAIRDLPRPLDARVRWTDVEDLHVTLRFLGEVDDPGPVVDALMAELPGRGSRPASLGAETDILGRALVVEVEGLRSLSTLVRLATAPHGEPPSPTPFIGHVTVARGRSIPDELVGLAVPGASDIAWEVSEVAVVRSIVAPPSAPPGTSNSFERLATVPLG